VLPCTVVCVILCLAILVELRLMTDRWTDGHKATAYTMLPKHRMVKTGQVLQADYWLISVYMYYNVMAFCTLSVIMVALCNRETIYIFAL